jgi:uncharacterized protein (DUF433 family)
MKKAKIISDPEVLSGKPVIAGTRISVELIMNFLGAGMSAEEINDAYPELKRYEILGAIDYAAELVKRQKPIKKEETSAIVLHEITRR